jgi:hypothetical protein
MFYGQGPSRFMSNSFGFSRPPVQQGSPGPQAPGAAGPSGPPQQGPSFQGGGGMRPPPSPGGGFPAPTGPPSPTIWSGGMGLQPMGGGGFGGGGFGGGFPPGLQAPQGPMRQSSGPSMGSAPPFRDNMLRETLPPGWGQNKPPGYGGGGFGGAMGFGGGGSTPQYLAQLQQFLQQMAINRGGQGFGGQARYGGP